MMDHKDRLVAVTGGGRLDAMDWGDVQPYVMFFTGRCGSTWLTELVAATGVAGNPEEWLNSDRATYSGALSDSLPGYFANLVEQQSAGGRFGLQIDPVRLRETASLVDWDSVFPADRTRTFFLYRHDLVAQAWSWVHARKSGRWHTTDPERPAPDRPPGLEGDPTPTIAELADQIVALRRQEEALFAFWAEHDYKPHFIEYETLVTDPAGTVASILRDVGTAAPSVGVVETKNKPLDYSDSKSRWIADFSTLNREALDALSRDRFGVSSNYLAANLMRVEPLVWLYMMGGDSVLS